MKKLLLVLALLIIGSFWSQGAYAVCNSNTDRWSVKGWCVDFQGQLTPQTGLSTNSSDLASQGGYQVPVVYLATANTPQTITAVKSGTVFTDSGGVTTDTLTGFGSKWTLPRATVGLVYTIATGSISTITVDTLDTSDTFFFSTSGTGSQMGDSIKSPGQAGDAVTVVCTKAGTWTITSMDAAAWTRNGTS